MKILILSALYPPHAFGGAEDCAKSFAEWASAHGQDVRVVMAAKTSSEIDTLRTENGVDVGMIGTPHVYPVSAFHSAPTILKPIWHFQDHFDGRAATSLDRHLDEFCPDIVMIHYLQGFGYRLLETIAKRRIPIAYVLHDLGLACIRMSMFRGAENCKSQCRLCGLSSRYKLSMLCNAAAQSTVGFISPSQANLDTLDRYFPVKTFQNRVILNTKSYPSSTLTYKPSAKLKLLFAGKLDRAKGIDTLCEAVSDIAQQHPVSLTVAGAGPLEEELKSRFRNQTWFQFRGFIPQEQLADEMAIADLLCVPSKWQENSPGVVIQALSTGLPVIATDRGGLPELIDNHLTGILLATHNAKAWVDALEKLLADRTRIEQMRKTALEQKDRFSQDNIGNQTLEFMADLAGV